MLMNVRVIDGIMAAPLRPAYATTAEQPQSASWLPTIEYLDPNSPLGLERSRMLYYAGAAAVAGVALSASYFAGHKLLARPIARHTTTTAPAAVSAAPSSKPPVQTKQQSAAAATASTAATTAALSAKIQSAIQDFAASQSAEYFIVVKDLKTGATASLNSEKVIESASIYKAFLANQAYLLKDQGLLNLSSPVGFGASGTISDCLTKAISVSDNTCGRALGAHLGWQSQHGSFRQQGYSSTDFFHVPTLTNASDVATLMSNIYTAKYLKPESSQAVIALLKGNQVNNRLPQGLPAEASIAHKTGELDGYMHDAGIVFGPKKDYVIVAMSGPWNNQTNSYASQTELSRRIYDLLEN